MTPRKSKKTTGSEATEASVEAIAQANEEDSIERESARGLNLTGDSENTSLDRDEKTQDPISDGDVTFEDLSVADQDKSGQGFDSSELVAEELLEDQEPQEEEDADQPESKSNFDQAVFDEDEANALAATTQDEDPRDDGDLRSESGDAPTADEPNSGDEGGLSTSEVETPEHLEHFVAATSGEPRPSRRSMFTRIREWFRKKFGRREVTAKSKPVEPIIDEEWAESAKARADQLSNQAASAKSKAEALQNQILALEQEQLRAESWLESMQRSYYWKLELAMEASVNQARSDIAEYESLVRELELPEKGTLVELRKRFHRGLSTTFLAFAIPAALLFLFPWLSRVNLFSWLVEVLQSPLFILLVVTIGAVVVGSSMLLRKVLGKKKVSARKSVKWTLISMLIPVVVYSLYRFQEFLRVFVTPVIEQVRPTTLWVFLILFTFLALALLINYYQGWSVFRRKVTEELAGLENVAAGYVKTRQELARLEFLYGQTNDWLKLLAHSLYRPWKVHPDWKSPNEVEMASESFPNALRVAQAVENDLSEAAQLRRAIAQRLLVQGWRSEAFEKSLSEIGKHLGYEQDKVSPELLEADLPHQPNNARKLVLEYFEHSASTAAVGTLDLGQDPSAIELRSKPMPSDRYLVEVARDQLNYLIDQSQGISISDVRPSVQQVLVNPLADLQAADSLRERVEVSEWDEFLADGLGIEDPVQPPLGVLAFTDEGRLALSAEKVLTKILVPERLAESLPKPKSDSVRVINPIDEANTTPAEILLRFDVSGPMPFSHVALVQNAARLQKPQVEEETSEDL
jgi:hypothetical protein